MVDIIRRAFSILTAREKRLLIPLVIMMVIGALLESLGVTLVIPLIAGIMDPSQLTDGIMGSTLTLLFGAQDGKTYLAILFVVMIAVFLVKNAFIVLMAYLQYKTTAKIRTRVQNRLLHYYATRPYRFFLDADSGNILRTVVTDSDYYYALLNRLITFFTSSIMTGILAAVVFAISPQITVLLMIVLAIEYAIVLRFIKPFLRKQGLLYREALGHGNSVILEMLRGIKAVKIGGKESFFERRYAADVDKLVHARMIEQSFYGAPQRFVEAITVSALLMYLLILLLSDADMTGLVPILSAFVLAAARVLPSVGNMSSSISYAHYYEGSLNRVKEIDDELTREEAGASTGVSQPEGAPESFEHEIRLVDVSYTYPSGDGPVFEKVCMSIPHNQSIGIVGPSGSGKTTLVDVMLGLLEAQSGSIYMDGVEIDSASSAWRHKFAYIPQNAFMLASSIRDNVVFGQAGSDQHPVEDHLVWEALETAQLADFVRSLKDGLDTEIGEAGVRLSGGQIQRLGIARALFSNAPILVFDEATSALDYETEEALMDAISHLQGTKTLIIVAHRLKTIQGCDLVYRVNRGMVSLQDDKDMNQQPSCFAPTNTGPL